jgi:hypothetical protein
MKHVMSGSTLRTRTPPGAVAASARHGLRERALDDDHHLHGCSSRRTRCTITLTVIFDKVEVHSRRELLAHRFPAKGILGTPSVV